MIVPVIQPILVGIFALALGRLRLELFILCLVVFYPLTQLVDAYFGLGLLSRKIDASILLDPRFQMFTYWLNHLAPDPFSFQVIMPFPWTESLLHFHNFFADIRRVSGVWALFFAVILVLYIFIRLVFLICLDKK